MVKIEHILDQGSGTTNEDRLIIGEHIFGVFDGATSLDNNAPRPSGQTGGSLAADIAGKTFAANHYPLNILGQSANSAILDRMTACGIDTRRPEQVWSTSAAVIRIKEDPIKGNRMEWFQTGDSHILLLYSNGSHKILADRSDHDYETLCMMKEATDKTLDNPVLKRQVLKVRAGMNKRYGVLNGDPSALSFAAEGTESLNGVEAILLFTDGLNLPEPVPAPKKSFDSLANEFKRLGLGGLHNKIRTLEKSDPARELYPRFKCHDDIAAIALHLIPPV